MGSALKRLGVRRCGRPYRQQSSLSVLDTLKPPTVWHRFPSWERQNIKIWRGTLAVRRCAEAARNFRGAELLHCFNCLAADTLPRSEFRFHKHGQNPLPAISHDLRILRLNLPGSRRRGTRQAELHSPAHSGCSGSHVIELDPSDPSQRTGGPRSPRRALSWSRKSSSRSS